MRTSRFFILQFLGMALLVMDSFGIAQTPNGTHQSASVVAASKGAANTSAGTNDGGHAKDAGAAVGKAGAFGVAQTQKATHQNAGVVAAGKCAVDTGASGNDGGHPQNSPPR